MRAYGILQCRKLHNHPTKDHHEPRALFDNLGFIEGGLGGLAIGLLALGVFIQQYNYRYNAIQYGLSNLEYDYFKNYAGSNSKVRKNPNRRLYKAPYRRRKIDPNDNFSGYGIVSAASNVYKTISKYFFFNY